MKDCVSIYLCRILLPFQLLFRNIIRPYIIAIITNNSTHLRHWIQIQFLYNCHILNGLVFSILSTANPKCLLNLLVIRMRCDPSFWIQRGVIGIIWHRIKDFVLCGNTCVIILRQHVRNLRQWYTRKHSCISTLVMYEWNNVCMIIHMLTHITEHVLGSFGIGKSF